MGGVREKLQAMLCGIRAMHDNACVFLRQSADIGRHLYSPPHPRLALNGDFSDVACYASRLQYIHSRVPSLQDALTRENAKSREVEYAARYLSVDVSDTQ